MQRQIPAVRFDQSTLKQKINIYLKAKKENPITAEGYCHGLALLWCIKMAERQENWFYDLIQNIILFPQDKLNQIIKTSASGKLFVSDFDKFINHIEWAHQSKKYTNIDQTDIDKILDLPERNYDKMNFDLCRLTLHLKKILAIAPFAVVAGQGTRGAHSIAVYFRDGKYYLFDGNYLDGKGKTFDTLQQLAFEVNSRIKYALEAHRSYFTCFEFFYSSHLKTQSEMKSEMKPQRVENRVAEQKNKPQQSVGLGEPTLQIKPQITVNTEYKSPKPSIFTRPKSDRARHTVHAYDHRGRLVSFVR